MPIILKARREIELMRKAGQLAHQILQTMKSAVAPGVTTGQLNDICRRELKSAGAIGLSKNYPTYRAGEGFPAESCISVNEEVVHGIPGPRVLNEGDIVTLDLALSLDGHCADTAITVPVGKVSAPFQKLLDVTSKALELATQAIHPDRKWSDVARVIQHTVESNGFSVVRDFVGHGIGRTMHEDPKVPNFVTNEQLRGDFRLRPGMTLAVEPMVVLGKRDVSMLPDGWTVVSTDGTAACHFEHTIAVTETGADVLTDGNAPWGL